VTSGVRPTPCRRGVCDTWAEQGGRVRSDRASRTVSVKSLFFGLTLLMGMTAGCRRPPDEAVIYCSADEEFARSVIDEFRRRSGLQVQVLFDTEAGKTTGLVRKIEAERDRPRADVFWSGEVFNTVLLGKQGLLRPYRPTTADDIPPAYRSSHEYWTGFGLRARVVAFNTSSLSRERVPAQWADLADPNWSDRVAMANPQFGTTRGHVAAMFAMWGKPAGVEFLRRLRENRVRIVDGNSAAVRMVARGEAVLCMTDSDDVWVARKQGLPVDLVYPSMGKGQGTLLIPNTVAILKGCRHPRLAEKVADFLASADVERMLARSESRNIPVRPFLRNELGIGMPPAAQVDYDKVAEAMTAAIDEAREILLR
jgi:iron(III) transport system substrate-binding protein